MNCHRKASSFASILAVQENIVLIHQQQGDLQAALQLENEVLQTRIKTLGVEHPKTTKATKMVEMLAHAESTQGSNATIQEPTPPPAQQHT